MRATVAGFNEVLVGSGDRSSHSALRHQERPMSHVSAHAPPRPRRLPPGTQATSLPPRRRGPPGASCAVTATAFSAWRWDQPPITGVGLGEVPGLWRAFHTPGTRTGCAPFALAPLQPLTAGSALSAFRWRQTNEAGMGEPFPCSPVGVVPGGDLPNATACRRERGQGPRAEACPLGRRMCRQRTEHPPLFPQYAAGWHLRTCG